MTLSQSAVVSGGVRLARTAGVEAVGVRALAAELAVTPMALYRHVPDAAALRQAVVETLLDDLPVVPAGDGWRPRAWSWSVEARRVLAGAPGLARFVLQHWTGLPPVLRAVESVGALFEASAPPGTDAVAAANTLFTYVLMRVQAEEAVRSGGIARDLGPLRARRHELPFLWAHRAEYGEARLDDHFAYGLDVVLAGLATVPPARRGHAGP